MKPKQKRILKKEQASTHSSKNRSRSPIKETQFTPEKIKSNSFPFLTFDSFWDNEEEIKNQEKHLVQIIHLSLWSELHQWAVNIIKKYNKITVVIPFGLQPQEYQSHLYIVKGVIISRITQFAASKKIQDQIQCWKKIYRFACSLQQLNLSTPNDLEFFLPQLLNASRAFLDNEDSVIRSLMYAHNTVKVTQPNETQKQKIQTFLKYFKQLLQTQLVVSALKKIQDIYSTKLGKLTIKQMQAQLGSMQIKFVEGASYFGMVSFQGIFIYDLFISILSSSYNAQLLGLLFHLGLHLLLIQGPNDFLELTPKDENTNQEGGFLFESILFGDAYRKYWEKPKKLLKIQNWNKEPPLFSNEELNNMERKEVPHFKWSGIYPMNLQLQLM